MILNLRTDHFTETNEDEALNRCFRFGDGIFETIKISYGKLVNEDLHLSRILEGMSILQLQLNFMPANEHFLRNIYSKFLDRGASQNGILRIYVFRGGGGRYLPNSNAAEIFAQFESGTASDFHLPTQGLTLGIYRDIALHYSKISKLKTCNAIPYTLAALFAEANEFNDVLLLDREGFVAECISSNIVLQKDEKFWAPSVYQGGVEGVMLRRVEAMAVEMNITLERSYLTIGDVEEADAVLLTNAVRGIQWVGQFKSKMYGKGFAQKLVDALNDSLQDPV